MFYAFILFRISENLEELNLSAQRRGRAILHEACKPAHNRHSCTQTRKETVAAEVAVEVATTTVVGRSSSSVGFSFYQAHTALIFQRLHGSRSAFWSAQFMRIKHIYASTKRMNARDRSPDTTPEPANITKRNHFSTRSFKGQHTVPPSAGLFGTVYECGASTRHDTLSIQNDTTRSWYM